MTVANAPRRRDAAFEDNDARERLQRYAQSRVRHLLFAEAGLDVTKDRHGVEW